MHAVVPSAANGPLVRELLRALAPERYLHDVSPDTWHWLRERFDAVPADTLSWIHAERHWWPAADHTDVILGIEPRAMFGGGDASTTHRRLAFLRSEWPALSIVTQWMQAASLGPAVGRCWLEFDAPTHSATVDPGCFIDVAPRHRRTPEPEVARFAEHISASVRAHAAARLHDLFTAVPDAQLVSVGWLGRSDAPTLRLCLAGPLASLLPHLTTRAGQHAVDRTLRTLQVEPGAGRPVVHLVHVDVGATDVQAIGIELICDKASQMRGVLAESATLAALVTRGLCPASQHRAACAFPGYARLGSDGARLAVRRLSHLKLVFRDAQLCAVKAYFAIGLLARRLRPADIAHDRSIR